MIKVENFSYSFPQKDLYKNISFTLEDNQHCAFIGTSGSGKSTLIDIIMDPERFMYDGTLDIMPGSRIGYVSQFSKLEQGTDLTVFDYIAEQFHSLQKEIADICTEMETSTELESLLETYQNTLDAFEAIGGDDYESIINKKLNLANLNRLSNQLVSTLSGGEFKLIQVIKEMLTMPTLIIMDEPDVFLDFENLNSLKNLINSHKGIMLIVTHNRYLLNHCFNKIIHLENMELQEFDGRYIDYNFSLLQSKIETQELAIADTEEIERIENVIDSLRKIASTHAEAARGKSLNARVKILERLEARRIKAPFVDIKKPLISLSTTNPILDEIALKVEDFAISFDDLLLENVSFEINSTDKVAIIGANGTGKTTLLRELYKNNQDSIQFNEKMDLAFLSQNQSDVLNESNTILDEFMDMGFQTYKDAEVFLRNYGFSREILKQKISSLSGGEKTLLQLAKISHSNANMLLLDEPTSHLDTYSQLALEEAIKSYQGAILMISHDFYSIVNCMDFVLIIEDKTIRKMSMRKFRKIIYAHHFNKDYLELEQKKKALETKIELALKDDDFASAKILSEDLEKLIPLL